MTAYFTQSQLTGLVGFGAFLWAVGVVKIRYAGHILYVTSSRRICTLLGTLPASYALILFAEYLFGISSAQRVPLVTTVAATTLVLDGFAMTWFPALYENESVKKTNPRLATVLSRLGAGWLLYGTGFCLAWAAITK
jgi:hypothetical protein